jgi:2-polyprenyl-3-methyl-5-hydroxy-6-metoxy-1,4-benzoquinol methylase
VLPDSYFDRFTTPKYRGRNPLQRLLIRRFVERFHALFVAANPVETVLEIGVGEGFLSGLLSERFPEKRFTGVDLDGEKLAALHELFDRVETHQADIYQLDALPGRYDLVICAEILEHLTEPERALEQICRLGPRRVIVTVPYEPWFQLSNLLRGKNLERLGNDPEHVQHWGRSGLRALVTPRFEILYAGSSYPWLLALLAPR